jgi:hypothetical protein
MNQPVYGVHLEAEIGLAEHFLVAALSYQVLVQEEGTSLKGLLRWDLGWQARWWDWITPAVEVHGAEGFLLRGRRDALFLSPEVRLHFGHFSGWLSVQIPLLDVAKYDKIVISLELAAQL